MKKIVSFRSRVIFLFIICTTICTISEADQVTLRNGNIIEGAIKTETPDRIVVEFRSGLITIQQNQIANIVRANSSAAPRTSNTSRTPNAPKSKNTIPRNTIKSIAGLIPNFIPAIIAFFFIFSVISSFRTGVIEIDHDSKGYADNYFRWFFDRDRFSYIYQKDTPVKFFLHQCLRIAASIALIVLSVYLMSKDL